jgi:hypothetical protein
MASQLAILLFLLIILLLTLLVSRRQQMPPLRPISAFDELPDQTARAVESGQTLHLSLGTGGVGGSDTVTSLASLSALAHLAEQGVTTDTPPLVTISDPTLFPLAQNVLREAYARRGRSGDFRWTQVRLVSPSPMAYALGTMDILSHEPVLANVMLGAFGPEVALIARAGAESNIAQIGGSDDPRALAMLYASTDHVVVGEELYATSTYLNPTPTKVASLAAEDIARLVLILFVISYAVLRLAGVL